MTIIGALCLVALLAIIVEGVLIMSQITDATAKIQANLDAIKAGVSALDAKIVDLSNRLASAGTLSADDAAALQHVVDASAALASAAAADPTAPAPTPPAAA